MTQLQTAQHTHTQAKNRADANRCKLELITAVDEAMTPLKRDIAILLEAVEDTRREQVRLLQTPRVRGRQRGCGDGAPPRASSAFVESLICGERNTLPAWVVRQKVMFFRHFSRHGYAVPRRNFFQTAMRESLE